MNKTNAELVKELMEVVGQYDSGLLTDYELLAKAVWIGVEARAPEKESVDPNTGLKGN